VTGTESDEAVDVVRALTNVYGACTTIEQSMRSRDDVKHAYSYCSMEPRQQKSSSGVAFRTGNGFGIYWWAEAEFRDGRALSFNMTLSWEAGRWIIDGVIDEVAEPRGPLLVELPERCAYDAGELVAELTAECNDLLAAQDRALQLFLERGRPG
jgi:hypothetical protein